MMFKFYALAFFSDRKKEDMRFGIPTRLELFHDELC